MQGWIPWLCIAAFLILVGFTRIRLYAAYIDDQPKLRFSIGFLSFALFPQTEKSKRKAAKRAIKRQIRAEKKAKKPPKPKKEPPSKETKEKKSIGFRLARGDISHIFTMVKKLLKATKRLLRIDRLEICLTPGGKDASRTALRYGLCNTAFSVLIPLLERLFNIKRLRYELRLRYDEEKPRCNGVLQISLSIGGIFRFGFAALGMLLGFLWKHSLSAKRKELEENRKQAAKDDENGGQSKVA